jgi:hypothetical protein
MTTPKATEPKSAAEILPSVSEGSIILKPFFSRKDFSSDADWVAARFLRFEKTRTVFFEPGMGVKFG